MKQIILIVTMGVSILGCRSASEPEESAPVVNTSTSGQADDLAPPDVRTFGKYWYRGEAELSSFNLEQVRYGEIREGKAVMIYVTEDFSAQKQVKLDNPGQAGDDAVKVLKLNATRDFTTGIYPYSMMSSIFTPVYRDEHPHTLKVTTSSQEWCGHTFSQINLIPDGYRVSLRSYFESEGDQDLELDRVLLEDEIWTLIRLEPEALPVGDISIIPGTMYQRLKHVPFQVEKATTTLEDIENGQRRYQVEYRDLDRTLRIDYQSEFPYEIERWEESYRSGRGPDAGLMTTRAVRDRTIMIDYWTRNGTDDEYLRAELNLD